MFDKNPKIHADAKLIEEISELSEASRFVEEKANGLGTGGMTSKIAAVRICFEKKIDVFLVNGSRSNFISDSLNGKAKFTRFRAG